MRQCCFSGPRSLCAASSVVLAYKILFNHLSIGLIDLPRSFLMVSPAWMLAVCTSLESWSSFGLRKVRFSKCLLMSEKISLLSFDVDNHLSYHDPVVETR